MLQKFKRNTDRESQHAGRSLATPTPSPEVVISQVVRGGVVDEGLYLDPAPSGISEAAVDLAIFI